jgi:hypothetical protein
MWRNVANVMLIGACCGLVVPAAAAKSSCKTFAGTATAPFKTWAVDDSRDTLKEAIDKWKAARRLVGPVSQTAEKPSPRPYWRSSITADLFLAPDVVTESDYTLCWKGVVSPVVCTSGAKLCW